jgi:type VI secretion system protein ImpC
MVFNTETSTLLKIKVLNAPKRELFKDLDTAVEFDQSSLFKKIYENEFGQAGGEPYGALIGDYEFTNHPDDVSLLGKVSNVAASAFCPFVSAASPQLMGLKSYQELNKPRDLAKIFDTPEYAAWKSYRDSEDSRFVTLVCPRVLSRLPYGAATKPIDEFAYEEVETDKQGRGKPVPHENYCWMNAAYAYGTRLTDSFSKNGWCTSIRGVLNGGKLEGLPAHTYVSEDGDIDLKCPAEVSIPDRREAELSKLGFLPLIHFKNEDYAVFIGGQTTQKPKEYQGKDGPSATANAAISARLPYIMAVSRMTHYLKIMGRDYLGSNVETSDLDKLLNNWIANYVCQDAKPSDDMKRKYPLAEAKIEVKPIPGKPGSYNAVALLRPWLQLEELTASMRLVAEIKKSG